MSQSEQQSSQKNDNEDEEEECCLFSCRCESARAVSTLLSCLKHVGGGSDHDTGSSARRHNTTPVSVFSSPTSLTFHVYGKSRQSQASVDMQAGLFSEYLVKRNKDDEQQQDDDWQADGGEFCVNLYTVLDCLHVLGSTGLDTTRLCLNYDLTTEIFRMELLDERGVLSTAAIPGMVPPSNGNSSLALAFRSSPICARMICSSQILREAMQELELVQGASSCTVALTAEKGLELAAIGDVGECLVSLPSKSTLSLESQTTKARTYPLQSLKSGMRALDISHETCISINQEGMMAIQHQVLDTVGSGSPNFVDFIMACLQDEDDDGDGEDQGAVVVDEGPANPLQSQQSQRSRMSWNDNPTPDHLKSDVESNGNDSDSEENDLPQPPPVSAIQPLFGSVVVGRVGTSSHPTQQRRKRPTRSRPSVDYSRNQEEEPSSDEGSRNLLEEPPSQEEESQPLDITEPASRTRRRRGEYDGSSSPEVVYGEMTQDDF